MKADLPTVWSQVRGVSSHLRSLLRGLFGLAWRKSAPDTGALIEADARLWAAVLHLSGWAATTTERTVMWLAATHPEFRTLFYHRLGRDPRDLRRYMSMMHEAAHRRP